VLKKKLTVGIFASVTNKDILEVTRKQFVLLTQILHSLRGINVHAHLTLQGNGLKAKVHIRYEIRILPFLAKKSMMIMPIHDQDHVPGELEIQPRGFGCLSNSSEYRQQCSFRSSQTHARWRAFPREILNSDEESNG